MQTRSKNSSKNLVPVLILITINLVIGLFIVKDYGIGSDEVGDIKRASLALCAYHIQTICDTHDYGDLAYAAQFKGTAQSMIFQLAENKLQRQMRDHSLFK